MDFVLFICFGMHQFIIIVIINIVIYLFLLIIFCFLIVQVVLSYPSGQQKKHVEAEVANVIKYLSLGLLGTACKTMMHTPELSNSIKELLIKEIDNELEELWKKRKNSILRQTKAKDLVAFKTAKFIQEIEKEMPILNQILQSICSSNNKKRASGTSAVDPNVKATIAATILRERCPEMSALAYRTGLVLRHTGAGGLVCL